MRNGKGMLWILVGWLGAMLLSALLVKSFSSSRSEPVIQLETIAPKTAPAAPAPDKKYLVGPISDYDYSTSPPKNATVIVRDASSYGPPYEPDLFQLELVSGAKETLFAKSIMFDLKKFLGKTAKVTYREIPGVVMGEQQLVIVTYISE